MVQISHLVVGLGNPGSEYQKTRHNIGFMAVEAIANRFACGSWKKKFKGLISVSPQESFLLILPQTYMNLSGESVGEAMHFYKLTPENVIVFHDDLDLQPGQIKIKQGGGAGGHNGLKSIDQHIGQNYWRVRLGIGRPGFGPGVSVSPENLRMEKGEAVTNFVLGTFAKADHHWLEPLLDACATEFAMMIENKPNEYLASVMRQISDKQKKD